MNLNYPLQLQLIDLETLIAIEKNRMRISLAVKIKLSSSARLLTKTIENKHRNWNLFEEKIIFSLFRFIYTLLKKMLKRARRIILIDLCFLTLKDFFKDLLKIYLKIYISTDKS